MQLQFKGTKKQKMLVRILNKTYDNSNLIPEIPVQFQNLILNSANLITLSNIQLT